ncbi:hypothetical protein ARMSODRAFT_1091141 [Armillaria solidipes]|uniref:Uncharacterized protein n=1 Tax=Armillaria solidipes TaxID=1076256 RepID=A0A2H3B6E0_9AGAR|nr:hypothetical protein ARMSODRAFT_1091141 [Armillaria solidipes]
MDPGDTTRHTTSSVGRRTASLTTHSSHLPSAPSQARSQQVLSLSQHSAYQSYLEASDEEILEELARRRRSREGEAPGELPQPPLAPVRSRSDLGARATPFPSTARSAVALSHVGSWANAPPSRVANSSPSRSSPGPSPALSTSLEARTSSSPPTAHRAAAPSHHGSWASAPLPHEGIYSPPPSLPLSAPARMPSAVRAAPSPLEGVVRSSPPPPLASPLHVEPTSLDHREVVSPSRRSRRVSQDVLPDTSYVPSPKTPRSTFITADIPRDNSSSILNRTNSSLSIPVQCDSDSKSENSSHDLSNFNNDLKAAIATLSLPQQPGESDVAFSRRQDAHACLTLGGPLIQDVVPSPITKREDISSHSASRLYRNLRRPPSLGSMDPGDTTRHTTSSVGRRTASLTTHSSHLPSAPSQARSQQVLSLSQHSAYQSYLEASDEEILEELARRRRSREGEAPGELPQPPLAPVRSRSDLGARATPFPSTARSAVALSHVGSWANAPPSRVANSSPSRSSPGPSPALSTSLEARTSSSPPTAHRAAAPSHHGSWASAPLPHEGIYSPPPSLPLSAPARMPSAVRAAPSPLEGVVRSSPPPPLASPLHVEPTSLDHREVVSPSRRSRRVSQDVLPDTSYVPSPKTPRSTFITADIPRDNSSSILNRTNSSLSIPVQCDSDSKSENSSHDLSNFNNDLKAAIATLSLPQQPGESDVAFSRRQDAHACLTLGGPLIQDVVPSPITKREDISSHSACFNRGRATAVPLNIIRTDSSPVKHPQSAFIEHDVKPSTCEPKRFSPQGSIEVKLEPKISAPIQHKEGTPLKKSELHGLPQEKSSGQQASVRQGTKTHRVENSLRDKMKSESFTSHAPTSLDSDHRHSASQRDTLGRPHRSLSSAPFQDVRYRSENPIFNDKEVFNYHPVARSETDVMLAMFQRFERLVARNLLTTQLGLDSNVQKTSLQSVPRPHKFHGDPDIIEFDNWLFSVIRWMKIANICGPIYHTDSSGTQQVSDIDVQRTNMLATFLDGDARTWYNNSVEDCNGNVEDDFPTFMQVINGLFRRFIHESSLYDVVQHFKSVTYASAGGVRQLFADLTPTYFHTHKNPS